MNWVSLMLLVRLTWLFGFGRSSSPLGSTELKNWHRDWNTSITDGALDKLCKMDVHILYKSCTGICIFTNTPNNTQKDIHRNLTVYPTHNTPEYFENISKWVKESKTTLGWTKIPWHPSKVWSGLQISRQRSVAI